MFHETPWVWLPGSNTHWKVFFNPGFWSLGPNHHGPDPRSQKNSRVAVTEALQLLRLKSLPDVWNGIKIPGMPSPLASSITVAQPVPPRASPKPQLCPSAFDASNPADRASPADTLPGRRQDS